MGRALLRRRVVAILFFTAVFLVIIDSTIGRLFQMPTDPQVEPSRLAKYFDYGRSIEGKLRRDIAQDPDEEVLKAGWLTETCDASTKVAAGKMAFDIYGMSFSNHVAIQMEELDRSVEGTRFSGPAAPPNHSYACFVRRDERILDRAPVQILGILASSLRRMETISGLTTSFEQPQPFTYPRYSLDSGGRLETRKPSIQTLHDLRFAFSDGKKWITFLSDLKEHDVFYDPFVMRADIIDHSVIGRMVRRAWGQRVIRQRTNALLPQDRFAGAPELVPVLRAMLLDFASRARARNAQPIVILFDDQGYKDVLLDLLGSDLKKSHIDFVATSNIAPADNPGNFVSDGHFTEAVDKKIAAAVLTLLRPISALQSNLER